MDTTKNTINKISQEFPFITEQLEDMHKRVEGAKNQLIHRLNGLRTGRPTPSMLEDIVVEAYGDSKKIREIGNISVSDSRTLSIRVWDKGLTKSVEKAVRESGLGFNPIAEADLVRVPVPDLTGEQRKLMARKASEYGEDGKIAVRNIRRDLIDKIKKMEKDKEISEDDSRKSSKKIQDYVDACVAEIDKLVSTKTKEIEN